MLCYCFQYRNNNRRPKSTTAPWIRTWLSRGKDWLMPQSTDLKNHSDPLTSFQDGSKNFKWVTEGHPGPRSQERGGEEADGGSQDHRVRPGPAAGHHVHWGGAACQAGSSHLLEEYGECSLDLVTTLLHSHMYRIDILEKTILWSSSGRSTKAALPLSSMLHATSFLFEFRRSIGRDQNDQQVKLGRRTRQRKWDLEDRWR